MESMLREFLHLALDSGQTIKIKVGGDDAEHRAYLVVIKPLRMPRCPRTTANGGRQLKVDDCATIREIIDVMAKAGRPMKAAAIARAAGLSYKSSHFHQAM